MPEELNILVKIKIYLEITRETQIHHIQLLFMIRLGYSALMEIILIQSVQLVKMEGLLGDLSCLVHPLTVTVVDLQDI